MNQDLLNDIDRQIKNNGEKISVPTETGDHALAVVELSKSNQLLERCREALGEEELVEAPPLNIEQWLDGIYSGVGGFKDLCRYEGVGHSAREAMSFLLRSLANPHCERSGEVLRAIQERRAALPAGDDSP